MTYYLMINGKKQIVQLLDLVIDTNPPYYCFKIPNASKFRWQPLSGEDPYTLPTEFKWSGDNERDVPKLLVESRGEPVSCQLYNKDNKLLKDYGNCIYLQRANASCGGGQNFQSTKKLHYYVGKKIPCVGSDPQSVVFRYEKGYLIPLSCEFQSRTKP